jgi:uncharacterized repeat protein (TIGR03803 family)
MLYGTTELGGFTNRGAVYQLSRNGSNQTLIASLGRVAGGVANPDGTLLQHSDGFLYGTTYSGGASNLGGIFKISTNGSFFPILKSFGENASDGVEPRAGLAEHPDGRVVGTTRIGGNSEQGTLFTMNQDGTLDVVRHHFTGTGGDSARPRSPLLIAPGTVAYGMTFGGGTNDQGVIYRLYLP